MTTPVNLRRVRKDRDKAEKRAKADENAIRFGRSKAEKAKTAREAEIAARALDGAKRET